VPPAAPPAPPAWPPWHFAKYSDSLLHPTAANIHTSKLEYYKIYHPYLIGDIMRRSPGRAASSDGTFRIMGRTKSDGEVLVLIIGEEHSIVGWFVTRSESWEELRPGLTAFRDRLERLGTLDQLAAWWSDRCCDGCLDVTKHALVQIMHGSCIWRAPYKDCFHGINGVTKTGDEGVPLQKSELGTGLFRAVREIPDSEVTPPANYLMRAKKMSLGVARVEALNKYRKSGIIRNRTYQPETQLRRWRAETEKWVNKAEACRREGARCVVRPQTARRVMGTIEAMAAAEPHIARGCWCDPWPMAQMYVCTKVQPVTGLQERLHIGDSGKNEVRHRTLNEIVEGIARLGEDVAEADIAFAIYQANREVDVLFGRVDEHSLSVFPWSDADLNADAADVLSGPPPFPLAAAPSSSRPPLGPLKPVREGDAEWEALGFDYLRHLEKVRSSQLVVAQAAQVAAQAIQAGEAEAEAEVEAAQAGEAEAEAETEGQAAEAAAAEEGEAAEAAEAAEAEPMATAVVIGPGGDSSLPLLPADMVEVIPPQFGALSFAGDAPLSGDEEDLASLATSPRRRISTSWTLERGAQVSAAHDRQQQTDRAAARARAPAHGRVDDRGEAAPPDQ